MLKMTIDNEEVLSDNDISIKEEILSPSSTILNNVYPKSWELDKDYTSRFYYPKDYSKLNIQNFSVEPEEAGTTIQINGSATLNDVDTTKESRVLALKGQTSQTGTPTPSSPIPVNVVSGDNEIVINGKNLFNGGESITTNGITFTKNSDGTYNITGTASASARCDNIVIDSGIINGETYIFWCNQTLPSGVSIQVEAYNNTTWVRNIFGRDLNNQTNTRTSTVNLTGADRIRYRININNGTTVNITNLQIQIEKGNQSTTYEPYIGNSYPLYLGVENLIDLSTITYNTNSNKVSISISGDTITQTNATSYARGTYYLTNLQIGKSYTFNSDFTNSNSCTLRLDIYNSTDSGTVIVQSPMTTETSGNISVTFTATETTHALRIYTNATGTANTYSVVFNEVHLVEGNNHISSTPIELCKIGTYQDYIYKDNGSWYLHKEIGKTIFNGSETGWGVITQSGGVNRIAITIDTIKGYSDTNRHTGYFICSHFKPDTGNAVGNVYQYQTQMTFYPASSITTRDGFLSWLNTNNVDFYYVLATPTDTEITDTTLLEQLESLSS